MSVEITVDGGVLEAEEGRSVLEACLQNGIFIPNLCHLEGMEHPPASCRLCFVALAGREKPVPACTLPVSQGLDIRTDTPEVRRLQRTALRFLLSVHHVDCRNCPANRNCELQRLARFLKIGLKADPLEQLIAERPVDDRHPCFSYRPDRCVLCGRCVAVCRTQSDHPLLAFAGRGFETVISFYGHSGQAADCPGCRACASVCPVGALSERS